MTEAEKVKQNNDKIIDKDTKDKTISPISHSTEKIKNEMDNSTDNTDLYIDKDCKNQKEKAKPKRKRHGKKNEKAECIDRSQEACEEEIITFQDGELRNNEGNIINHWNYRDVKLE